MPANLAYGYGDQVIVLERQANGCANFQGTVIKACQECCCIIDPGTGLPVKVPTDKFLVKLPYTLQNVCTGQQNCLEEEIWYCEQDLQLDPNPPV